MMILNALDGIGAQKTSRNGRPVNCSPVPIYRQYHGGAVGDNGRPEPADGVQQARPAVAVVGHSRKTGAN